MAFKRHFAPRDKLWLFGSRANLSKAGGDIDLYVETHISDTMQATERQSLFISDLIEKIGDQKIDVILNVLPLAYDMPIYDVAKTGVRLI